MDINRVRAVASSLICS